MYNRKKGGTDMHIAVTNGVLPCPHMLAAVWPLYLAWSTVLNSFSTLLQKVSNRLCELRRNIAVPLLLVWHLWTFCRTWSFLIIPDIPQFRNRNNDVLHGMLKVPSLGLGTALFLHEL